MKAILRIIMESKPVDNVKIVYMAPTKVFYWIVRSTYQLQGPL